MHNANTRGKSKGANDKARHKISFLRELEQFFAAYPDNRLVTEFFLEQITGATIVEILGHTLGDQVLRLVEFRQAKRQQLHISPEQRPPWQQ